MKAHFAAVVKTYLVLTVCMWVLAACLSVQSMCSAWGGKTRTPSPLEVEWRKAVGCRVGVRCTGANGALTC